MSFFRRLRGGRRIGGYIQYFGLEKWYTGLPSRQRELLLKVRPDLETATFTYTSETVGRFISSCASEVAKYDADFAEQLYDKAQELDSDVINRHYLLISKADFYKDHLADPAKWFKVIQDDLALLPAFVKAWKKRERIGAPGYPAVDEMIRVLRNRGDLPEALALCREAQKLGLPGDWETQMNDLRQRMQAT